MGADNQQSGPARHDLFHDFGNRITEPDQLFARNAVLVFKTGRYLGQIAGHAFPDGILRI